MNKDIIAGKWHIIKGHLRKQWGELTDDEVAAMNGSTEELHGILLKKYGYDKDRADEEIHRFLDKYNLLD